jgi:sulfate transporter 4
LPVQYGLYSALVPLYVYAIFGSSRQLSVGPVAITSLLLSSGLTSVLEQEGVAADDPSYEGRYIQLAIQTALLVGIAYGLMAALRLGFITLFLSHAVISGFTSGAAIVRSLSPHWLLGTQRRLPESDANVNLPPSHLPCCVRAVLRPPPPNVQIIALSQVKYIFGYSVPRSDTVYGNLINLFDNISQFNYKTFLLGMGSLAILVLFKRVGAAHKRLWYLKTIGPLAVSVLGIVLVAAFALQDKGIPIVGSIPQGFPPVTASLWFPMGDLSSLLETVVTITLVGLMESIAISRQLAKRHGYKINPRMELSALGLSNLASAMFSGYPTTGSFSRSAVNSEAGAETQLSSAAAATLGTCEGRGRKGAGLNINARPIHPHRLACLTLLVHAFLLALSPLTQWQWRWCCSS